MRNCIRGTSWRRWDIDSRTLNAYRSIRQSICTEQGQSRDERDAELMNPSPEVTTWAVPRYRKYIKGQGFGVFRRRDIHIRPTRCGSIIETPRRDCREDLGTVTEEACRRRRAAPKPRCAKRGKSLEKQPRSLEIGHTRSARGPMTTSTGSIASAFAGEENAGMLKGLAWSSRREAMPKQANSSTFISNEWQVLRFGQWVHFHNLATADELAKAFPEPTFPWRRRAAFSLAHPGWSLRTNCYWGKSSSIGSMAGFPQVSTVGPPH